MTGPEHYRAAEQILINAWVKGDYGPDTAVALAAAQAHATLALTAATAEPIVRTLGADPDPIAGAWSAAIS